MLMEEDVEEDVEEERRGRCTKSSFLYPLPGRHRLLHVMLRT
jgi:hypothetical protein